MEKDISASVSSGWQIESLFKQAFIRTKERFLTYFLILFITFFSTLVVLFGGALLTGIVFLIYSLTKLTVLVFFLGVVVLVIFVISVIYIASWGQLAINESLIHDPKLGSIETIKKVRPLVWGYFRYTILLILFSFGLSIYGFLSLGVVWIVWGVWGVFGVFVYLKQKRKGLDNLWVSKQMVSQRFWGILGRLALVYGVVWFIQLSFSFNENNSLRLISTVISFIAGPFIIAYIYEIYKNLSVPDKVKRPMIWIILSIIGGILLVIGLFFAMSAIMSSNLLPTLLQQMLNKPVYPTLFL
ncbi:MAG: hypothetical protein HYW86_00125 [Candidatus Roizmanbacteria bacterium]|nr:MAG: hypothetical protein HYW86_00125 [Candidatus Roizmanbacteria bacterium]